MTPKQKAFIESVVSLNTGNNRPALEAALKLYVINEGVEDFLDYMSAKRSERNGRIFDDAERIGAATAETIDRLGSGAARIGRRIGRRVGSAVGRVGRAIKADPGELAVPEESYDVSKAYDAVESERFLHTWDHAYQRLLQACDFIGYFLKNYGSAEIIQYINTPDFKASLALGDEIDRLRPSPMYKDTERVRTYIDLVESMRTADNSTTVDAILNLFEASETVTTILPLTESAAGHNIMILKNELAVVQNFNSAHGSAPWRRWYTEHRMDFAMGSRNNWADRQETVIDEDDED